MSEPPKALYLCLSDCCGVRIEESCLDLIIHQCQNALRVLTKCNHLIVFFLQAISSENLASREISAGAKAVNRDVLSIEIANRTNLRPPEKDPSCTVVIKDNSFHRCSSHRRPHSGFRGCKLDLTR